jgi:hypothetical protein
VTAVARAPIVDAGSADAAGDAAMDTLATFDAIAARAPIVAAGMREAARREATLDGASRVALVRADARDVCVRVAFVASAPIDVTLESTSTGTIASTVHALEGLLGERGPVCVRRGDSVDAAIEGDRGTRIRFVVWW